MLLEDKVVFYLEDDVTNLAIVRAILERHGAKVYNDMWGTNTLLQLKLLKKVDIILLDLMLSRTNYSGYDIYDKIKAEEKLKDVPIVLITAADPDTELETAKKKGFDGYIAKPISRKTFPEKIASVLNGEKLWDLEDVSDEIYLLR